MSNIDVHHKSPKSTGDLTHSSDVRQNRKSQVLPILTRGDTANNLRSILEGLLGILGGLSLDQFWA